MLVDYYAMPNSWPGRANSTQRPITQRGIHVEQSIMADFDADFPARFHPCVQLHEFESLLFIDPDLSALSIAIGGGVADYQSVANSMKAVRTQCGGLVEQINDSPETSPSKRLTQIIPSYDKVAWGVTAAADIKLPKLRDGCPWLDRWVTKICGLSNGG